ncbi:MAG TPA: CHAT domain-containing protein, partial [Candidatus Methylomirabilis sp.]
LTVVPDQDSYSPLLDLADVAYLRFDGDPGLPATIRSPGILVADPTHSPEFWRRYPTLSGLPNTVEETETILARSPGSQLLKQDTATKRTLLETWEHASFLYIAAHFVRDTELPYLVFLPLAPDSTAPGSTFLELSEIRAANLGGCALVVLSGCSSGAPYSEVGRWGPGLGNAFLDAGASSVIQTFWSVGDETSRHRMADWTRHWADGAPPLHALCEMRRESRRRGDPLHIWAAYAIALGGL